MKPDLIVGKSALIVIDMQNSGGMSVEFSGIPTMSGFDRFESEWNTHSTPMVRYQETMAFTISL